MGDWNEDFARGRREQGWSNQPGAQAYNQGSAQAQRDQQNAFFDEQRRAREQMQRQQAANEFPSPVTTTPWAAGGQSVPSAHRGAAAGGIDSLTSAAKSGAVLLLVLFGLYALLGQDGWTGPQLLGGAGIAVLAGAAAGAALYIAVKLLVWGLKVSLVLLAVGVGLHLLGAIDLPQVLHRVGGYALGWW